MPYLHGLWGHICNSKGGFKGGLEAICNQGEMPYSNPNLAVRPTSLMVGRVYHRSTTQGNQMGGLYQILSTKYNGKIGPNTQCFDLEGKQHKER